MAAQVVAGTVVGGVVDAVGAALVVVVVAAETGAVVVVSSAEPLPPHAAAISTNTNPTARKSRNPGSRERPPCSMKPKRPPVYSLIEYSSDWAMNSGARSSSTAAASGVACHVPPPSQLISRLTVHSSGAANVLSHTSG